MKNKRSGLLSLAILIPLVGFSPVRSSAQSNVRNLYISVDGSKQGVFKPDSPKPKIQGLAIAYEVKLGQTGRRSHSMVITREAGASSPQFFSALFTNELLKTVTIEFYRSATNGTEEIYQTIKLTNATVADVKQYTRTGDQAKNQTPLLEDVTFVFQRVEISSALGKTSAADDLK